MMSMVCTMQAQHFNVKGSTEKTIFQSLFIKSLAESHCMEKLYGIKLGNKTNKYIPHYRFLGCTLKKYKQWTGSLAYNH